MADLVLIPLPGVGTLSLTRDQYEAALIPLKAPAPPDPPKTPAPVALSGPKPERLLRMREVRERVGLNVTTIYQLIAKGQFPKQVHLSERCARWPEREIDEFLEQCKHARGAERATKAPPEMSGDYIRMGEIMKRTGFDHAKIYDLIRQGDFPKWADLPKRASAWHRHEVEAWLTTHTESPLKRPRGRPRKDWLTNAT